jgi:hypothetical protein
MSRTPTTIEVTVLDLASIEAEMTVAYRQDRQEMYEPEQPTVQVAHDEAVVDTPAGLFILDTEGVGMGPLGDDEKIEFNGYAHTMRATSLFPVIEGSLTVAEVRALATGERVNLADFVRTFGHRLDSNYHILVRAITEAGGMKEAAAV